MAAPDPRFRAHEPGAAPLLLLVDHLGPVGPGRQVALLATGLPPRFHAAVGAGPPPPDTPATPLAGVTVHDLPLAGPLQPVPDLKAVATVRRLLGQTGVAVLHTHTPKAGAVGRLAAVGAGHRPRLVHTFHGPDLAALAAGVNRHAAVELERRLARRTDVLVTLTPESRDALLDLRIGEPHQYRVIPLGLDLDPYRQVAGDLGTLRRAIGVPGDVPLAGMLGPLVAAEDHPVVFRALVDLPHLHLAVLGTGPLDRPLREAARQLGLADRVHFTGWWTDIPAALADLDVVVVARHDDATPAGLLEAVAAGRPAVAADAPGTRAVIEDGLTGWLCRPGDPGAFAWALRQVTARPVEAMARTSLARRRVVDAFGKARLLAAHTALYDDLLRPDVAPAAGSWLPARVPARPIG